MSTISWFFSPVVLLRHNQTIEVGMKKNYSDFNCLIMTQKNHWAEEPRNCGQVDRLIVYCRYRGLFIVIC